MAPPVNALLDPTSAFYRLLSLAALLVAPRSTFPLSPLAAIALSRSRSFSRILIFSEKLRAACRARIFCLLTDASKVLMLELLPPRIQPMTIEDTLQLSPIHRVLFDKLQNAVVVFRPPGS